MNINFAHIPNILTVSRIILTLPIVFYLLKGEYFLVIVLISVAGITDGLDGFIAKKFNYQSRLGSILDPLSDKMLLLSCYASLYITGIVPFWLLMPIVIRDVLIIAGTVGFLYGYKEKTEALLEPTNLSKVNTVLQILLVILLVMSQLVSIDEFIIESNLVVVLTSTILSGIDYAWVWLHKVITIEKNK